VGGTDGYVHAASRLEAWRGALEAAGVAPGPDLVGDFTGRGGAAATRALLALPQRPTAVVYANDLMAVAGMSVALGQGLTLPADLSVVGFDDVPLAAHVAPALTTVRQDVEAWGRAAARALLAKARGEAVDDLSLTPSRLVVRSSSSPPGYTRP
jgi:DNA-binding LacI/PurR family transcriptional regulator